MRRTKDTDSFAIVALLLFGLVMSAVTLTVLYLYPVAFLTCRYTDSEWVDCRVQERMVGLITIEESYIVGVKDAYVVSEVHERLRPRREIVESKVYKLTLVSSSGTINVEGLDEFGGIFVNRAADKINDYLSTSTDEPLRIWQASWIPLVLGTFFLLVSLVILYAVVDAVIRRMVRK